MLQKLTSHSEADFQFGNITVTIAATMLTVFNSVIGILPLQLKKLSHSKDHILWWIFHQFSFSGLTLLVGWQEGPPACKKRRLWFVNDDNLTEFLHVL